MKMGEFYMTGNMKQHEKKRIDMITVYSFWLSLGIVFIHNHPMTEELTDNVILRILKVIDSKTLQVMWFIVPTYFLISGFLFYRNYSKEIWLKKVFGRMLSLGIPFAFWNILFTVLNMIDDIKSIDGLNGLFVCAKKMVINVINSEFTDLWFLRYLMVCVLLSPLLYFLIRDLRIAIVTFIVIILIKFIFVSSIPVFPSYYLPIYTLGGILALHFESWFTTPPDKRNMMVSSAVTVIGVVLGVVLDFQTNIQITSVYGLIMPLPLWFVSYGLMKNMKAKPFMDTHLFVYIVHYNLLIYVSGILGRFDFNVAVRCLLYPIVPITIFALLVCVGVLWKKISPRSWSFVNGGR